MGLNSTPFLSYQAIQTENIDIFDDAWGFSSEFNDVISLLDKVKPVAGKRLTKRLIERIRQED